MDRIVNLNSLHLNYLTPLLKWRVLDLESLRKECVSAPKYKNFHRIIRNLEKQKILEGYRDPFSRKKFVYLSSFGECQLSLKENPAALSKDTLIHDIKVSELCRELMDRNLVDDIELEHQIHDKRQFKVNFKIIPDAILYFTRKGHKYQVALELELTRKNNQRLVEKMRQYQESSFYQYVIYLFPSKNLMMKYMEVAQEKMGLDQMGKFLFFYHEDMSSGFGELDSIQGITKDKKITLGEVFASK